MTVPFPVSLLLDGPQNVATVRMDDSLQQALELMIGHNYSQLPIVDASNKVLGLITSDSILRTLHHVDTTVRSLHVHHAKVRAVTMQTDDDLFDLVDRLRSEYAVLIVDGQGRLVSVVTTYDTSEYFRARAQDMMYVQSIEHAVREHLIAAYGDETGKITQETIARYTGSGPDLRRQFESALSHYLRKENTPHTRPRQASADEVFARHLTPRESSEKTFDDLSLDELIRMLLHEDKWSYFAPVLNLDREFLQRLLSSVRETRNRLAHFRGRINSKQRDQLRYTTSWFAEHQPLMLLDLIVPLTESRQMPVNESPTEPVSVAASLSAAQAGQEEPATDQLMKYGRSRYSRLSHHLQSQAPSKETLELTFADVERVIDGPLPPSAEQSHKRWWANDSVGHIQSKLWLGAGWKVSNVDFARKSVTFTRTGK